MTLPRPPLAAFLMGGSLLLVAALVALAAPDPVAPDAVVPAPVADAGSTDVAAAGAAPSAAETMRWCGEQVVGVRALADHLRRRAAQLDERERTIGLREAALREAAAGIEGRLVALEQAQTQIVAGLDADDLEREDRIKALVKMVESNRAGSIAPMVGELEPALAVTLLDRMNRTKAGKLLAELPAAQAAALASRMTNPIVLGLP